LLGVQARFGDLYAWFQQDSGHYRDAQYWLDRALDWALMAEDKETSAFILARKSQVAGEMGHADDAVGIAHLAERRPNPNQNRHASIAETYAAYGYALRGDKASCLRAYDRALGFLGPMKSEPPAKCGHFLDRAYIEVYRAHSVAALGDNIAAADAFGAAIESLPAGYHRDRGIYLTNKAKAHAGAKQAGPAAESAMTALAIGAETNSVRIMAGLRSFEQTLPVKWADVPEIREFRSALYSVSSGSLRSKALMGEDIE
jgi:tetratricopeptide (TPR) repeat protein